MSQSSTPIDALAALLGAAGDSSPFDAGSRYRGVAIATIATADGRTLRFVRRRLLPPLGSVALSGHLRVQEGDRPDTLAAAAHRDPSAWWRLCDANGLVDAGQLTVPIGRIVRVPLPEGVPGGVL